MATSTSTLLDVVNQVLIECQERSVSAISSNVAQIAKTQVQRAFEEIQEWHEWEWLRELQTPETWDIDKASFTNIRKIDNVFYKTSVNTHIPIPFIDLRGYLNSQLTSFSSSSTSNLQPRFWTKVDEDTIRINPYPTDTTNRVKVLVDFLRYQTPPVTDAQTFNCPERFIHLLVKLATSKTAFKLGHNDLAQSSGLEFRDLLRIYQNKEDGYPQVYNMYSGSRGITNSYFY